MKRTMTSLMAMFAVIAAMLIGTGSPAAAATTGPWQMQPYTNNYCLAPEAFAAASGTVVDQHLCETGSNRDWNFTDTSGGHYYIAYRNGGKCMAVKGNSSAERTKIVTQVCGDARLNDQWIPRYLFSFTGADYYQLKNRSTGKCLAVEGNSVQNGADMMQFTCIETSGNQAFTWARP